jgi:hypothetical protein
MGVRDAFELEWQAAAAARRADLQAILDSDP